MIIKCDITNKIVRRVVLETPTVITYIWYRRIHMTRGVVGKRHTLGSQTWEEWKATSFLSGSPSHLGPRQMKLLTSQSNEWITQVPHFTKSWRHDMLCTVTLSENDVVNLEGSPHLGDSTRSQASPFCIPRAGSHENQQVGRHSYQIHSYHYSTQKGQRRKECVSFIYSTHSLWCLECLPILFIIAFTSGKIHSTWQ